jgi:hypothetical protein
MAGMPVDDLTEGLDNGTRELGAVSQHRGARNRTPPSAGLRGACGATQLELMPVRLSTKSKRPLEQQGGVSLSCPEPGTHLTIHRIRGEFEVISVVRMEEFRGV